MKRLILPVSLIAITVLALTILVVAPALASWRLTYPRGAQLNVVGSDLASASQHDMSLVAGEADYIVQSCCPHSIVSTSREMSRFTVRAEDPKVRGSLRSELRFKSSGYNVPTSYRANIRLQSPWVAADELVIPMQWHAQKDKWLGEPGRYPPLEFAIDDGRWVIVKSFNPSWLTLPWDTAVERVVLAELPIEPGKWNEWLIAAVWSTGQTGRIDIWKNGELVVADRGPNAYGDAVAPYWKLGTYRPQQAKRKTPAPPVHIDFSDIKLEVAPEVEEK